MVESWVSAASISLLLSLLPTYCYLVPSVLGIPGKKYVRAEDDVLTLPEDDGQSHRAAPLLRRSFRLEDFLWSGSGDGPDDSAARGASPPHITTVFRTTTIVTTVYHTPTPHISWTTCTKSCLSSPTIEPSESLDVSPSVTIEDAPTPSLHRTFPPEATPSVEIPTPTPTLQIPSPTKTILPPTHIEPSTPYPPVTEILPQYWLLTVVRGSEAEETVPSVMASRLARLYKKAFMRQQERHLGILKPTLPTLKREEGERGMPLSGWRKPRALDPVLVRMIKVTKKEDVERPKGDEVEMLYSVHVGNRPVLAKTAAEDMKLISEEEASKELGFPVVTKAEPYLKDAGRSMSSNGVWRGEAWAVVVVAIAAGFLILLVAALLAFIAKRQRKKRRQRRLVSGAETTDVSATTSRTERRSEGGLGAANRRQVFESGACTNLAYEGAESDPDVKIPVGPSRQVKGHTWLPEQSDVFPAPSAPRRSESAHSIGGDPRKRGPRRHVRPPQRQYPEDRGERGDEEDEEEDKDYAEEAMEESREDVRVVPEKRRYLREKSTTKRRRRPPGKVQLHPSSTLGLEDPLPRRRPPSPQEDFLGSEGEWTFSPVPLHKSMASPTSYLSMPSVRAFPKGANIPEPLALVLEGNRHPAARDSVSVRHLDIYPEASAFEPHRKGDYARHSRHGSIDEDPGVLGPKVFEVVRRERELRRQSSLVIGGSRGSLRLPEDNIILPLGEGARLRKRFHDLLDDTLLLFGKRYGEQSKAEKRKEQVVESGKAIHQLHPGPARVDFRSQSAYARAEEPLLGYLERPPRPKTSMSRPITADVGSHGWSAGQRRSRVASAGPRGAWGPTDSINSPVSSGRVSSTISLFTRPVSAGPFHSVTPIPPSIQHDSPPPPAPTVDTNLVLVDAQMPASDPAIPLIQAIKAELRKFHPHDTPS